MEESMSNSQLERKKSYRWVSATKVNYDGSDWSDHNDNEQEDGDENGDGDGDKDDDSVINYLPSLPNLKITNPTDTKEDNTSHSQPTSPETIDKHAKSSTTSKASKDLDNLMNQISMEISTDSTESKLSDLHTNNDLSPAYSTSTGDSDKMMMYSEDDDDDDDDDDDYVNSTTQKHSLSDKYNDDNDEVHNKATYFTKEKETPSVSEPAPKPINKNINIQPAYVSTSSSSSSSYFPSSSASLSNHQLNNDNYSVASPMEEFQFKKNFIRHSILNSSDEEAEEEESLTKEEPIAEEEHSTDVESITKSITSQDNKSDFRENFIQESNNNNNNGKTSDDATSEEEGDGNDTDDDDDNRVMVDEDGNVIDATRSKQRAVSGYSEVGSTWNAFPEVMGTDDIQTIADTHTIYDNATIFNVPGVATNRGDLPPLPTNRQSLIHNQEKDVPQQIEVSDNSAVNPHDPPQDDQKGTPILNKKTPESLPKLNIAMVLGDPKVSHSTKIEKLKKYSKELEDYDTCIQYWINDTLKSTVDKKIMENYKVNIHVKHAYSTADEISKKNHLVANVNQNVHQLTKKVFSHSMREKSKGFLKSIRDIK